MGRLKRCSFCTRSNLDVPNKLLVQGMGAWICLDCARLALEIIELEIKRERDLASKTIT